MWQIKKKKQCKKEVQYICGKQKKYEDKQSIHGEEGGEKKKNY